MAKAQKPQKPASALTSDEVMDRLFGKGAAKKLRKTLDAEDARKSQKTGLKTKRKAR